MEYHIITDLYYCWLDMINYRDTVHLHTRAILTSLAVFKAQSKLSLSLNSHFRHLGYAGFER